MERQTPDRWVDRHPSQCQASAHNADLINTPVLMPQEDHYLQSLKYNGRNILPLVWYRCPHSDMDCCSKGQPLCHTKNPFCYLENKSLTF